MVQGRGEGSFGFLPVRYVLRFQILEREQYSIASNE